MPNHTPTPYSCPSSNRVTHNTSGSAYQESLGGFGGIQHCLIPAPKHIIIDRDKSDNEYYTRLFAKEQSYRSMLRILGY